jgi:exodeoxyribonuclease VII small subunit
MSEKNDPKSIEILSFEDAIKDLENRVRVLESGQRNLEDSLALYERGVKLRQHCEQKLSDAQLKVEKIVKRENGTLETETFADGEQI